MTYFDTKAAAEAFDPTPDPAPQFVGFHTPYGDWLGAKVAAQPAHDNQIEIATGEHYARVYAQVATPASVTELGLLPDQGSSVDVTPAWNKVLATGFDRWFFPRGTYYWKSEPDFITAPMILSGASKVGTIHKKAWKSANHDTGIFNIRSSDVKIESMMFQGTPEAQGIVGSVRTGWGCHVGIVSPQDAGGNYLTISHHLIRDCNFTSEPTAATVGGALGTGAAIAQNVLLRGAPTGADGATIRTVAIENCTFFGCEYQALGVVSVGGLRISGGAFAQAGGKTAKIYLTGTAAQPSRNCVVDIDAVATGVLFEYATLCRVDAASFEADANGVGNIRFSSVSSKCRTRGHRTNVSITLDVTPYDGGHSDA